VSGPIVVRSIAELKTAIGTAASGSFLVPAIEEFFFEGGATALIGRVVGSAAVLASATIQNVAKAATSFIVNADNPGAWGNKLEVQTRTEAGNTFSITVLESGVEVEKVTGLASAAAAVEWATNVSQLVNITEVKAELPAEGLSKLGTGSDGNALTTERFKNTLKLFPRDLGCGQVAAPGVTTQAVQEALLEHAELNDRTALIDAPQGATLAELKAAALALRASVGARRGAMFSTWATIPGLAPGTTRKVPWSAVQAGLIARSDATLSPPPVNESAAGINGQTHNVLSLANEFSRAEREELDEARVIGVRNIPVLGIETYGNVTLTNPQTEPAWAALTAARLFMFVTASCEAILERFVLREIDPHGLLFAAAGGALQNFLESLGDQLYNPASEAVNTGPQVNTLETIKKKQLNAAVLVQPSPSADTVTLNITAKAV
jgi:phage tail sheath protein FI